MLFLTPWFMVVTSLVLGLFIAFCSRTSDIVCVEEYYCPSIVLQLFVSNANCELFFTYIFYQQFIPHCHMHLVMKKL